MLWSLLAVLAAAGCINPRGEKTLLVPEGLPKVRQVFLLERLQVMSGTQMVERIFDQLAFGDFKRPGEEELIADRDANPGAVNVVARQPGEQRIRIIMDELLLGSRLEEIGCGSEEAEFFSVIPDEATPDDIARCSPPDLSSCLDGQPLCLDGDDVLVGIFDADQNAAPDEFRMRRYDDGKLAVRVSCEGVDIPLNQIESYWNPSGNQFPPVLPNGTVNINGIGPGINVQPLDGFRTNSECTLDFNEMVVDHDGEGPPCAPADGNPTLDCLVGDTALIKFRTEALKVTSQTPMAGSELPALSTEQQIAITFNASMGNSEALNRTLEDITVAISAGQVVASFKHDPDNSARVVATFATGFEPMETYTITITTTLTDRFGGSLPETFSYSFTTGALL